MLKIFSKKIKKKEFFPLVAVIIITVAHIELQLLLQQIVQIQIIKLISVETLLVA